MTLAADPRDLSATMSKFYRLEESNLPPISTNSSGPEAMVAVSMASLLRRR